MSRLIDFCINITDGEHNTVLNDKGTGYYLLANENLIDGQVIYSKDDREINLNDFNRIYKRCKIENGDVLVSTVGELGKLAIVENYNKNYVFQRSVGLIKTDKNRLNPYYLYYLLNSKSSQKQLKYVSYGSMQKGLTLDTLKNFDLNCLPSVDEQRKKVMPLRLIDEQIKRNNVMVQKLQVLGQAIYTKFFSNEKNIIPLLSFPYITILRPGIKKFEGSKHYIATAEVEGENLNYKAPIIEYETRENRANMQPIINSVWFAKMKNSIKHIYISKVDDFLIDNYIFSTGFFGIKCDEVAFEYLINYINLPYFEKTKDVISHGATMEGVNNEDLKSFKIQFPPKNQLESFHNKVKSIYYEISKIAQLTYKLTLLKEKLLPLLINGQIS